MNVVEALTSHRVCPCNCYETLPLAERTKGIAAVYHLDDALRGWGYTPLYDVHGDLLWREAQKKNDPSYRGVAVRFNECIYRRLLGSMLHECIHALCGDVTKANYGVLFGLPYGVPVDVAPKDEEAFLDDFNFGEARAWVGVWILGRRLFSIDWELRTARDIGTYGFPGGNALVPVIPGFRAVAHIDRQHHPERYYPKGRKLEERARTWFAENLESCVSRVEEAAAIGNAKRPRKYPDPATIAKIVPKKIGRNEPCVCGSSKKYKDCCAESGRLAQFMPSIAR
jgi:hypothetical protein